LDRINTQNALIDSFYCSDNIGPANGSCITFKDSTIDQLVIKYSFIFIFIFYFHFHFHFYFISKVIGKKQNRYSSQKTPKTTRTQFKKPMIPQYYKEVLNK